MLPRNVFRAWGPRETDLQPAHVLHADFVQKNRDKTVLQSGIVFKVLEWECCCVRINFWKAWMRFQKFWEGCKAFPPRAVVGGWAGARTEPERVFGWMPGSQDIRLTCLNRIRKVSFRLISGVFGSVCVALRRHWRILQAFVLPPESPEFVSPCLLFCNVMQIGTGLARVFRIVCS